MSYDKLKYLDLEVKPVQKIKTDSISFPCFSTIPSQHLLHTTDSPQLNSICDLLVSVLYNQKSSHSSSSSTCTPKYLRDISDKLEYLRASKEIVHLQNLNKRVDHLEQLLSTIDLRLKSLESITQKIYDQVQSLL